MMPRRRGDWGEVGHYLGFNLKIRKKMVISVSNKTTALPINILNSAMSLVIVFQCRLSAFSFNSFFFEKVILR